MIEIGELVVRVPSMTEAEGINLGNEIAQQLSQHLPESGMNSHIGDIHVRIAGDVGLRTGSMAQSIATQILAQLNSR